MKTKNQKKKKNRKNIYYEIDVEWKNQKKIEKNKNNKCVCVVKYMHLNTQKIYIIQTMTWQN